VKNNERTGLLFGSPKVICSSLAYCNSHKNSSAQGMLLSNILGQVASLSVLQLKEREGLSIRIGLGC